MQKNIVIAAFFWVITQRVVAPPDRGPETSVRITTRCVISQNGAVLVCFAAEACNYEKNSTEREFRDGKFLVSDYVHSV